MKDSHEGGSEPIGGPIFKSWERRFFASSGHHGKSPAKCGRCSAAEAVSRYRLVIRIEATNQHSRPPKKVDRPHTAHLRNYCR